MDGDGHPELLVLLFPLPARTLELHLHLELCLKHFVGLSSFLGRPLYFLDLGDEALFLTFFPLS